MWYILSLGVCALKNKFIDEPLVSEAVRRSNWHSDMSDQFLEVFIAIYLFLLTVLLLLSSLFDSLRRQRWFCNILKQGKPKSLLKFSTDRLSNNYQNLEPKKRSKSPWTEKWILLSVYYLMHYCRGMIPVDLRNSKKWYLITY